DINADIGTGQSQVIGRRGGGQSNAERSSGEIIGSDARTGKLQFADARQGRDGRKRSGRGMHLQKWTERRRSLSQDLGTEILKGSAGDIEFACEQQNIQSESGSVRLGN